MQNRGNRNLFNFQELNQHTIPLLSLNWTYPPNHTQQKSKTMSLMFYKYCMSISFYKTYKITLWGFFFKRIKS